MKLPKITIDSGKAVKDQFTGETAKIIVQNGSLAVLPSEPSTPVAASSDDTGGVWPIVPTTPACDDPAVWTDVFYNDEQSYTASCAAGMVGDSVTETVAANTVTSLISKADANAIALAIATSTARSKLSCAWGNDEQSVTRTCPEGTSGTPVTITIPANTVFSAVSKANANNAALAMAEAQADEELICLYWNTEQTAICPQGPEWGTETESAGTHSSEISQEDADQKAMDAALSRLVCVDPTPAMEPHLMFLQVTYAQRFQATETGTVDHYASYLAKSVGHSGAQHSAFIRLFADNAGEVGDIIDESLPVEVSEMTTEPAKFTMATQFAPTITAGNYYWYAVCNSPTYIADTCNWYYYPGAEALDQYEFIREGEFTYITEPAGLMTYEVVVA